jgi:Peptide N-acetyl-beta-D-glucosaminyl asparaginase amidase A
MTSRLRLFHNLSLITIFALLALLSSSLTLAQSTNRQIGTQYEVTADPTVPRPNERPCIVQLFSNYQFALFSETTQTFNFTPPSDCSGPWEKVVFEADFSENAGYQFDRTASIYIANTNVYFGTTPEPLQSVTNTWHVERDITDYSALLNAAQQGTIVLQNCTGSNCGSAYSYLNGVFTVSAELEFYPAGRRGQNLNSDVADAVLPMVQSNGNGGVNLPAFLLQNGAQFTTTFTLPRNIERAYLDVISQSQQTDEQWYACFPNNLNPINLLFGCGNTDFRETDITIDGQPAGIAPVSPWVFTGFLPDQWVPIPAAQTLEFVPYRVNLTPFAALLNDGSEHTVTITVFDDNYYFSEAASLLLYLDKGSKQVTGELTKDTLTAPNPVVTENLNGTATVTGTIGVTQNRDFTVAGYVNTSHGKVSTSIFQQQKFSSTSTIDFDTVNQTVLDQNTAVHNSVSSSTTVSSRLGTLTTDETFSFPITVDVIYPVSSAEFGLTVATAQNYQSGKQIFLDGFPLYFSFVNNSVEASDVSPASSSQHYVSFDSTGQFYDCQIASKNNTLTSVSPGCSRH